MPAGPDKSDLIQAYADALKVVWVVMCAVAGLAMVASWWTVGFDLDRPLETEQGFEYERKVGGAGGEKGV